MGSTVVVIGPGRVGTTLALRLDEANYHIVGVSGRSPERVQRFVDLLPEAVAGDLEHVWPLGDLVVVTTPDDLIADVAKRVAEQAQGNSELCCRLGEQRWIHTSGSHGVEPFRPLSLLGASVAACHPAMTFPDHKTGYNSLPGTSWAVTADANAIGWARLLVNDLFGSPVEIGGAQRNLYHAGLTVGSNATTAVVAMARDLLGFTGMNAEQAAAFLTPLVETSARNGAADGIGALTGPISRGDVHTVAAHLDAISSTAPVLVGPYIALGRLLCDQAEASGLDPTTAQELRDLFDQKHTS